MATGYSDPPFRPSNLPGESGHRLLFVHIDHLLQAHSVADPVLDAECVEPTLDESTVSQDAAREQTSVFPEKSSQLCLLPEKSSKSCVSPEKSSQSCVSPEKPSTHTSVQRERRYPDRIRKAPKRLDV